MIRCRREIHPVPGTRLAGVAGSAREDPGRRLPALPQHQHGGGPWLPAGQCGNGKSRRHPGTAFFMLRPLLQHRLWRNVFDPLGQRDPILHHENLSDSRSSAGGCHRADHPWCLGRLTADRVGPDCLPLGGQMAAPNRASAHTALPGHRATGKNGRPARPVFPAPPGGGFPHSLLPHRRVPKRTSSAHLWVRVFQDAFRVPAHPPPFIQTARF